MSYKKINKKLIKHKSVSVDEQINDKYLDKFISHNCSVFGFNVARVRVFYCCGISTYEFYEFCEPRDTNFIDADIYASFYQLSKKTKYKLRLKLKRLSFKKKTKININTKKPTTQKQIQSSESSIQNQPSKPKRCDIFVNKKIFSLYQNKELIFFKDIDKHTTIKDIIRYVNFVFGDSLVVERYCYVSNQAYKKIKKLHILNIKLDKLKSKYTHKTSFLYMQKEAYLFILYFIFCVLILGAIVFNHFNHFKYLSSFSLSNVFFYTTSLNEHTNELAQQAKGVNSLQLKYDKDIYLNLYLVLKLLQKTNIQIKKINLSKNNFNMLLVANTQNKLLNFAMKHKNRVKLKNIQKTGKTYTMDINFGI